MSKSIIGNTVPDQLFMVLLRGRVVFVVALAPPPL